MGADGECTSQAGVETSQRVLMVSVQVRLE